MTTITRRSALTLLTVAPAVLKSFASPPQTSASTLFLGTYTDPVGAMPGAKGVYSSLWNAATGEISSIELAAETPNPTFLARSPVRPNLLFAVNELSGKQDGTVSAFARKPGQTALASLQSLNIVNSGGSGPCHLALDHTGRALFVANYGGGSVSSFKVSTEGLSEAVSVVRFTGSSIDPGRQTTPHTHCVLLSPDNRFLLVNDLGLDRIMVFEVDPAAANLIPAATPYFTAKPGAGPRHSLFHPNGRWVYSVNELNSTIDLLDWDSTHGVLSFKETISSLPANARTQKNAPAELAIDRAGKFLYVSNRFHNSIGVFAIAGKTGALTPVEDIPCGGKIPRDFVLDPTEQWLLVANQDSRNIVVFKRNSATGKLTATGKSYTLDATVCLLFA